ncbi:MAG: protein translocase subunit SecD [Lachnospiraceae bacterium]|nr:protein translocase subunit SecD [Lachnospiraceae bacterium]
MKKGQGIAWLVVLLACIVGFGYLAFNIVTATVSDKDDYDIRLGLDLAGGVSITYQVVGDKPSTEDLNDTITKLQKRIENELGSDSSTTEASVYPVGDDRITVEIPGVKDANALLEELGTPGSIYFIKQTDASGNQNYTYDSSIGNYKLNYELDDLIANGSVILQGSDVKSATATNQQDQTTGATQAVVSISLTDKGTKAFADATTAAYAAGQSIGIYYDGQFVSVPKVNAAITDGKCVIEGMKTFDEADSLASYIRIGGLNLELKELQSEVVGAQLGSSALSTSLLAAAIGLIIVMAFLIFMYRVPGVAASLALALYTGLMLFVLWAFDITLTLPGIAGIILSIGMAVDANVIIFARIREEIAAGKSVIAAIEIGFKKALSAIIDGNVTTLIAAAVLGVLGSGTVKGFAITLAIGVVLSMFTALVITRILMNALYAVGVRDAKFYGKAKKIKNVDFVGKKAIFFTCSILVICVGIVGMAVHGIKGDKSLNYSLEFLGGTSTTVEFNEAYSLAQADDEIVPKIADVIGSNDIQTQVVDNTNQIIFKTKSLNLEQREAFNTMLEKDYSVDASAITSSNIGSTVSGEMRSQSMLAVVVAAFFMLLYIWFRFKDLRFAGSAIIALIHDVLVVLALYAVARISVGSAFIACMLTVIGYSVNDTIVIFDRIRENKKTLRDESPESLRALANESITQTLSRSISTSLTTVVMVLMLLILGVTSIREFALPLLVGIVCGTYSSICIATELWYVMKVHIKGKKKTK